MKYGFVGASNIAHEYMINAVNNIGSSVEVIMSSDLNRARTFMSNHVIPEVTSNMHKLLDMDIDSVYISTTNELHCSQAIEAMEAGKNVLVEKPAAMTTYEVRKMINAAVRNKVTFGVNHHLRAHPAVRAVKAIYDSGELGKVLYARVNKACLLPPFLQSWRVQNPSKGAGVAVDITAHVADTLRFVLGADPVTIKSHGQYGFFGNSDIEDGMLSIVHYNNGVDAITHEGFTTKYANQSLELHGTNGSVIARECLEPNFYGEVLVRSNLGERVIDLGVESPHMYEDTLMAFESGRPLASGEDGFWSLSHALSAKFSASQRYEAVIDTL